MKLFLFLLMAYVAWHLLMDDDQPEKEFVSIPAGTVRARSLAAGVWYPGSPVPAGTYEIIRRPNGVFHALMPAGQERLRAGTYYYPMEPHPWQHSATNAISNN